MKTILLLLLLTSLSLAAQTPPPPAPPAANTKSIQAVPAPPSATNGEPATLKRLKPAAGRSAAAPPSPVAVAPASGAGAVSAPGAAALPALPTAPAGPITTIKPTPATPTAIPAEATTPPAKTPTEQTIPPGFINWVGADLNNQVLPIYADMVGRSILRPAALPAATIVFKNQTELTKQEAIQAIDAVLALNGIAMINVGEKFVKALPLAQAGGAGGAISTNDASGLPELGGYQTHVVQLKYLKPSEVMPVIQPFASVGVAPPIVIESSQMLVLRDYTENVKRMLEMIRKVDVTVPSEFVSEVIPIKFAKVADISAALNSLSGGGGGGTTVGTRSGGTRTGATGMTTGARPGQSGYNPGATTMQGTLGSQTGTPSSGASFSDRIKNIISKASSATGSGDLQILGVTKIVADERSNSLLIFASRQDMAMIKDIVSKLDVVLAQVLIETIIMDITFGNSFDFGVSAVQGERNFSGSFSGAGGMNANKFFDFGNATETNGIGGLLGSGLRYFGKIDDNIYVTLEAMAQDGRANVIQKPRIQTSHATPASIFIGDTVPYISGSYYGYGGSSPSSSYQQLRVGIGLSVTPFINQDGLVVMQIDEQIEGLGEDVVIDGNKVPKTTSRTLTAEVAVRDGETIMLGGFIKNSDKSSKSGVPFLKDIPLLGYLFRSTANQKDRTELIVLMRPTVLRTPELAAKQVDIEKERLPGVRAAEADLEKVESGANPSNQKKSFTQEGPFTPEEERLYGKPATVQP